MVWRKRPKKDNNVHLRGSTDGMGGAKRGGRPQEHEPLTES